MRDDRVWAFIQAGVADGERPRLDVFDVAVGATVFDVQGRHVAGFPRDRRLQGLVSFGAVPGAYRSPPML